MANKLKLAWGVDKTVHATLLLSLPPSLSYLPSASFQCLRFPTALKQAEILSFTSFSFAWSIKCNLDYSPYLHKDNKTGSCFRLGE